MPHTNLRILMFALVACYVCYLRAEHNPYSRHIAHAFEEIEQNSLYDLPGATLFSGAVEGMVEKLHAAGDEHSSFMDSRRVATFNSRIEQQFGGVGILLSYKTDPNRIIVSAKPEPGTPAGDKDIRIGDEIVKVDGKRVVDLIDDSRFPFSSVIQKIRGPLGKPVLLSVLHRDEKKLVDISIKRGIIKTQTVLGHTKNKKALWMYQLKDHPEIAHISIESFGERTTVELIEVLNQLRKQGVNAIILDLRDNPGGLLNSATEICDLFLEAGQEIVSTKDRYKKTRDRYIATGNNSLNGLHVAILINRNSASASEIVSACLQDHDRAIIIGERTFGKGTVQYTIPIGPAMKVSDKKIPPMLKLTSYSYWRPSGRDIHRQTKVRDPNDPTDWGVRPDKGMEVTLSDEEYLAFLKNRSLRKAFNPDNEQLPSNDDKPSEPFVDKALDLAIEQLEAKLQKK